MRVGAVAGTPKENGYVQINVGGRFYYAHRLAWLYMTGKWPTAQIDHINRMRADNRWENLREATHVENMRNSTGTTNATGFRGVYRDREPYGFYFQVRAGRGHRICRGGFRTAEEAAIARAKVVAVAHGDFAPSAGSDAATSLPLSSNRSK